MQKKILLTSVFVWLVLILLLGLSSSTFVIAQEPEDFLYEMFSSTRLPESYRQFYNRYKTRLEINKQIEESRKRQLKRQSDTKQSIKQLTKQSNNPGNPLAIDIENRFDVPYVFEWTGITQSQEGDIYICGNGYPGKWVGIVVKLDGEGNKIWDSIYNVDGSFIDARGITVDDESNVYLSVIDYSGPRGIIVKYDKNGNLEREAVLPIESWYWPYIGGVIYANNRIICSYDQWIEYEEEPGISRGVGVAYYDKDLNFISKEIVLDEPGGVYQIDEYALAGITKDEFGTIYIGGFEVGLGTHGHIDIL